MNKKYLYLSFIIIIINGFSLYNDVFFKQLISISKLEYVYIDKILINEVYSNSFGFISTNRIKLTSTNKIYKLVELNSNKISYLKMGVIKNNGSLFFIQNIYWITKMKRKIIKGRYTLYIEK
jgi:hypothetical protein